MADTHLPFSPTQFRQFASTNGIGTGEVNSARNHSLVPVDYYVQPPPDRVFYVGKVLIAISSNKRAEQTDYGDITNGLLNGTIGFIKQKGVKANAFGEVTFKQNLDWYGVGSEVDLSNFAGVGQTLLTRFATWADTSGFVQLDGRSGDQIGITVQDDLSSLLRQTLVIRGIYLVHPWLLA